MGRLFCNGKKSFCERAHGSAEECEKVSCTGCEFADGTGAKFIDKVTNYDRIRNMSIDEMVDAIRQQIGCGSDFVPCGEICGGECNATKSEECFEKVKQWLESETE